jgi:hypothetical protein
MSDEDPIAEKTGKVGGMTGITCGVLYGLVLPGTSTDERALHAVVGAVVGLLIGWIGGIILGKVMQATRDDWISSIAFAVLVAIILLTIYKLLTP